MLAAHYEKTFKTTKLHGIYSLNTEKEAQMRGSKMKNKQNEILCR